MEEIAINTFSSLIPHAIVISVFVVGLIKILGKK